MGRLSCEDISLDLVTMIETIPVSSPWNADMVLPHDSEWFWTYMTAESDIQFVYISAAYTYAILALRVGLDR